MKVKIYICGQDVVNGAPLWRADICKVIEKNLRSQVQNLDPFAFEFQKMTPEEVFGKDCHLIQQSDLVIAYMSDDMSIGGFQEMMLAKYLGKPLLGIIPLASRFHMKKGFLIHPFAMVVCDRIVSSTEEGLPFIQEVLGGRYTARHLNQIVENSTKQYLKTCTS